MANTGVSHGYQLAGVPPLLNIKTTPPEHKQFCLPASGRCQYWRSVRQQHGVTHWPFVKYCALDLASKSDAKLRRAVLQSLFNWCSWSSSVPSSCRHSGIHTDTYLNCYFPYSNSGSLRCCCSSVCIPQPALLLPQQTWASNCKRTGGRGLVTLPFMPSHGAWHGIGCMCDPAR